MSITLAKEDDKINELATMLIAKKKQKLLAVWAINCVLRTIHFYEDIFPNDYRMQEGLKKLRLWIDDSIKMWEVRKIVLESILPAAREAKEKNELIAEAVARACAHATSTCHVATHSIKCALYAATAIKRATDDDLISIELERKWQYENLLALSKQENTEL